MRVLPTSKLTSLDRLHMQMQLDDSEYDDYLTQLILEYSSAIEDYLDRSLGRGQYTQTIYIPYGASLPERLFLYLYPIVTIDAFSYNILGETPIAVSSSMYYTDEDLGTVYLVPELLNTFQETRYDQSGKPLVISVQHTGGYIIPDNYGDPEVPATGELPRSIEATVVDLCKAAYYTRTINPTVKMEFVPDVLQRTYFSPDQIASGTGGANSILTNLSSYQDNRLG